MRVILLERIASLGGKYEVVDVSPGHARNFLIPNELAKPATEKNINRLRAQKAAWEKKKKKKIDSFKKVAEEIGETEVKVKEKANEEGKLFGSVDKERVKKELEEKGFSLDQAEIEMEPVKETGEWRIKVLFPFDIESEIKLIVEEE